MKTGIFLLAALLLPIVPASATERDASDGYALLYGLSAKERKADLIFWIKDASEPIHATTKKIARLYARIGDDLKRWADADRSIDLKTPHLPQIELDARDAIDHGHTKQLMEDAKGRAFEHMFMILQWQSLWYGQALCGELADRETVPERRKALQAYAKELRALGDEVYAKTD